MVTRLAEAHTRFTADAAIRDAMAPASGPRPAQPTAPRSPSSPTAEENKAARDDLRWGELQLVSADAKQAANAIHAFARRLGTHHTIETAHNLQASTDPAETIRLALREAVVYETKRLARVFTGRIVAVKARGHEPEKTGADNIEPARHSPLSSQLAVHLQTEEDERELHLEGAWAWNFLTSGAQEGDIVQIDRKSPLVTVKNDPALLDGRVLDERPHWVRLSLGSLDRVHAQRLGEQTDPTTGAETDAGQEKHKQMQENDLPILAAASLATLFATGERGPSGPQARVATDRWLRRHLQEHTARLEPGVLLVTEARQIPEAALAALHAAMRTPSAPAVVFSEDEGEPWEALVRAHPACRILPTNPS